MADDPLKKSVDKASPTPPVMKRVSPWDMGLSRGMRDVESKGAARHAAREDYEAAEKAGLTPEVGAYAKGGQVGKVGSFGLKRSKPDFAGGGGIQNFKKWSK